MSKYEVDQLQFFYEEPIKKKNKTSFAQQRTGKAFASTLY